MNHLVLGYVGLVIGVIVTKKTIVWRVGQVGRVLLILPATVLVNMNMTISNVRYIITRDFVSLGLTVLSIWLLPLILLASQQHIVSESLIYQRVFVGCQVFLTGALVLAFIASDLLLFYIAFESTLLPTLILITR